MKPLNIDFYREETDMLEQTRMNGFDNYGYEVIELGSKGRSAKNWRCRLDETLIGEYLIIPLTSNRMLRSEAYWMSNCCGRYADLCAKSKYSIFSIRTRSGERLATLAIVNLDGTWVFDQCYGAANSEVLEETFEYVDEDGIAHSEYWPTELYYVVHEVVRLMNGDRVSQQ